MSLLDCVKNLPTLYHMLDPFGVSSDLVRATLTRLETKLGEVSKIVDTFLIHPNSEAKIDKLRDRFTVPPRMMESVVETPLFRAFSVQVSFDSGDPGPLVRMPNGMTLDPKNTFLHPTNPLLNEFGFLYVALYISGMFSRYFPDLWMQHISQNSELTLLIELICAHAMQRLPLLTLSELDGTLYLYKD